METDTNTTHGEEPQAETPRGAPPELVRPVEGRMIGGVAKALANRFDIEDWIPRVAFIVTAFIGGLGLALYIAGWVVLRSEDETEPPAARFFSRATSSTAWIGIGLIFVAMLVLLDRLTFLSSGTIWAGALLVVGILLYLGQMPLPTGDKPDPMPPGSDPDHKEGVQPVITEPPTPEEVPADVSPVGSTLVENPPLPVPEARASRSPRESSILGQLTMGVTLLALGVLAIFDIHPGTTVEANFRHYLALATVVVGLGLLVGTLWGRARWLILVAVVLIPSLFMAAVAESGWNRWEQSYRPTTFAEVQTSHSSDVGSMRIDLTALPWEGEEISLDLSVEVGRIQVLVPHDIQTQGTAQVSVGQINTGWGSDRGWGINQSRNFGFTDAEYDFESEDYLTVGTVNIDARAEIGTVEINVRYVERENTP